MSRRYGAPPGASETAPYRTYRNTYTTYRSYEIVLKGTPPGRKPKGLMLMSVFTLVLLAIRMLMIVLSVVILMGMAFVSSPVLVLVFMSMFVFVSVFVSVFGVTVPVRMSVDVSMFVSMLVSMLLFLLHVAPPRAEMA